MFELYKDYGSKLGYKDQVARESMHEALAAVRTHITETEAWLDERHILMKAELVSCSAHLGEAALAMLVELSTSPLNLPDSDPAVSVHSYA